METSYRAWERKRQARRSAPRRKGGAVLGPRETRRLIQLGVCILLFLVVFIGKGVFPEEMEEVREQLTQTLQTDTDFRAAFAGLGRSLSQGEPVWKGLNGLWSDVFGRSAVSLPDLPPSALYQAQLTFLWGETDRKSVV